MRHDIGHVKSYYCRIYLIQHPTHFICCKIESTMTDSTGRMNNHFANEKMKPVLKLLISDGDFINFKITFFLIIQNL